MEPLIKKITQIGIVTRDIKNMIKHYEEDYGITDWFFTDGEVGFDPAQKAQDLTTRGVKHDFEISLAQAMIGDVQIELIQPLDEFSDYAQFLKEKGEGVHHICVQADTAHMPAAMKARGVPELLSGTVPGVSHFVYYDTVPDIGMTLEVVYPPNHS